MEETIKRVIQEFKEVIPPNKFSCEIKVYDHAVSGHYSFGFLKKIRRDIGDLPLSGRYSQFYLVDEMLRIKDEFGLSPYSMELKFNHKGKYKYSLHFPKLDFENLSEVEKSTYGFNPSYVYINLRPEIIRQFDDFALSEMVPKHVEEARKILKFESDVEYTKSISEEFYLFMINVRAQGEINSGCFDNLYIVFNDFPADIIVDIYRSFELLGNLKWTPSSRQNYCQFKLWPSLRLWFPLS